MKQLEQIKTRFLESLHKAEDRFNAFSKRERVLALLSALIAVYVIWYATFFGGLLDEQHTLEKTIQETSNKIASIKAEIQAISVTLANNPLYQLIEQVKTLSQKNSALKEKMIEQTKRMVSPKEMATIIKSLVEKTQGLNITLLESRGSHPLFETAQAEPVHFQVYQHGLKLEMTGDYFQTLQFLKSMESQSSKVLWTELEYQVEEYPRAKIHILIETLGSEEGWIGV